LKIEGTISNAKAYLAIQKEFGSFNKYLWSFVEDKTIKNAWGATHNIPSVSPEAVRLSKDMKKRGFKFCGPTVTYAFMQGSGLVNDHTKNCFRYTEVSNLK
jgi:DNA-3-methyladenine glycosylase I